MSTLWSYFKQRGETLPSIEERRQKYGLGADYSGTAQQNIALLQRLGSGGAAPAQQPQPQAQAPQAQAPATDWRSQMAQMEQYRGGQMEQAGIPELRASIGGLRKEVDRTETLLESLRPDIEKRTQDYLVPEAYRNRMEAVERQPLTTELAGLTRGLGVQEQTLSGRMGEIDYRTQMAGQLMAQAESERRAIESETRGFEREKELLSYKESLGGGAGTGTAGERARSRAETAIRADVEAGVTLADVIAKYKDSFELYEIINMYNELSRYGPAKEKTADIQSMYSGGSSGGTGELTF